MSHFDTVREALNTCAVWSDAAKDKNQKALTALAQIEADHFTAADMASAAAQGHRDGVASVQQGEPVGTFWQHPKTKEWYQQHDGEPLYRAAPVAQQPQAEAASKCAQCQKPYKAGATTKGCPKCAPGVIVPEAEFQKPIAAPQQAEVVRDAMVEAAYDAVADALRDAYDCTRDWSAWSYGTMGPDDFVILSEDSDRVREIAGAAIDAAWQAMRDAGHPPDGHTPLAQAITKALAPQQAEAVPPGYVIDRGFRWDGENQQHIPQLTIEFEPVPANGPCDAKGWKDRDAVARMFMAQGAKT